VAPLTLSFFSHKKAQEHKVIFCDFVPFCGSTFFATTCQAEQTAKRGEPLSFVTYWQWMSPLSKI